MSYNESDTSYDDSGASTEDEFDPWEFASGTQSASEAIAERVKEMQRLFKETMALASAFDVRVSVTLESEHCRGHNQDVSIFWNPSSQYC
jgi:hypothetical protein